MQLEPRAKRDGWGDTEQRTDQERSAAGQQQTVTVVGPGEGDSLASAIEEARTQMVSVLSSVCIVALFVLGLAIIVGIILRWIPRGAYAETGPTDCTHDVGPDPGQWPSIERTPSAARQPIHWDTEDWENRWNGGHSETANRFQEESSRSWAGSQDGGRFRN